jgi:hypothetical protein
VKIDHGFKEVPVWEKKTTENAFLDFEKLKSGLINLGCWGKMVPQAVLIGWIATDKQRDRLRCVSILLAA